MPKIEEIHINLGVHDVQTGGDLIETLPLLYSNGIYRTGDWDGNISDYNDTDHVFYRDYANNNLIYVWLTNQEYEYPDRTAAEVMDYLILNVFGDFIVDIQDMLENKRNTIVFADCTGELTSVIKFSEENLCEMGINIHEMTDGQILAIVKGWS
jgi:hypothetical protein